MMMLYWKRHKAKKMHQEIVDDIKTAYPYWPLGTSHYDDNWSALALNAGKKQYLSVWRRGGSDTQTIPLPQLKGRNVKVRCAYPQNRPVSYLWNEEAGTLSVKLETAPCARTFEIECTED